MRNWLPARGHSGGILVGVRDDVLEVEGWETGIFFLGVTIRNRLDNFRWVLFVVYGPAQHEHSSSFLAELTNLGERSVLLYVIGGDFNLVRTVEDRSSGTGDRKLMEAFNNYIEHLDLREMKWSGGRFTWTGSQKNPSRSNIDRVLVTTNWEQRFPLSSVGSLTIVGSDHCPMLLDSGERKNGGRRQFFFEKQWLKQEDFLQRVRDKWEEGQLKSPEGIYSLDKWHGLLGILRKKFKGWGDNLKGEFRRKKTISYKNWWL